MSRINDEILIVEEGKKSERLLCLVGNANFFGLCSRNRLSAAILVCVCFTSKQWSNRSHSECPCTHTHTHFLRTFQL